MHRAILSLLLILPALSSEVLAQESCSQPWPSHQAWDHGARIQRSQIRTVRTSARLSHHRCTSGCWSLRRERTWVPGVRRMVHEPARYGLKRVGCRWVRVCLEPARSRWVQEPGHWEWRHRRVRTCH